MSHLDSSSALIQAVERDGIPAEERFVIIMDTDG